jgi:bile acid-coenzyme A ligase
VLGASPLVRSCAVIGLPDGGDMGSRVHAIVDVGDAPLADAEARTLLAAVDASVRAELAPYKRPRSVELHAGAPLRNDAGKVRRSELRRARMQGSAAPDSVPAPGG